MKLSGKMRLIIPLKFTKNHGFTLSLENTFFKKPRDGCQVNPPPSRFGVKFALY